MIVIFQALFPLGEMVVAVMAVYLTHWRVLQFAMSLTILPVIILSYFVPESHRWYISRGMLNSANNVASTIMKRNKTKIGVQKI